MKKEFPQYHEVSEALAQRQKTLNDAANTLDPQQRTDLEQQCAAIQEQQQKLVLADTHGLGAIARDVAHLEHLLAPRESTWLDKLDHYNELVGKTTFDTVQDLNLVATLSQMASQFIYPIPIIGAAVLGAVELVNILKATAFDQETQNRRAVKIASGLAIVGLTVAAAVLILNPIGLALTAAAYTVKVGRDRFVAHKADKDYKLTLAELEHQQGALRVAEKQAYAGIPSFKTAVDAIKALHSQHKQLTQQLQSQDPKSEAYTNTKTQLASTQKNLAAHIAERNTIVQQQRPDIVRLALKTHCLAEEAKELAKVRDEKMFDARVGCGVIVGAALTVFGGPAAIVGACLLVVAATTAIAAKSAAIQTGLSNMWHAITGKTPQPSPTHDDQVNYIQKNTLHLDEVRTFDPQAKNNYVANHYHATPALHEAVRDLNHDLSKVTHPQQEATPLPTKPASDSSHGSAIVDKLHEGVGISDNSKDRTPTVTNTPSPSPSYH